jgi:hypothetical protein
VETEGKSSAEFAAVVSVQTRARVEQSAHLPSSRRRRPSMNPGASLASTCTIATRPRRLAQSLSRAAGTVRGTPGATTYAPSSRNGRSACTARKRCLVCKAVLFSSRGGAPRLRDNRASRSTHAKCSLRTTSRSPLSARRTPACPQARLRSAACCFQLCKRAKRLLELAGAGIKHLSPTLAVRFIEAIELP